MMQFFWIILFFAVAKVQAAGSRALARTAARHAWARRVRGPVLCTPYARAVAQYCVNTGPEQRNPLLSARKELPAHNPLASTSRQKGAQESPEQKNSKEKLNRKTEKKPGPDVVHVAVNAKRRGRFCSGRLPGSTLDWAIMGVFLAHVYVFLTH